MGIMRRWPDRMFSRAMLNGGEENMWPFQTKDATSGQKNPSRTFTRDVAQYIHEDWSPLAFLSAPPKGILIRNLEQDGFFWDRYHDLTLKGHKKMQLAVMPPQVSGLAATFKSPPPGCAGPPAFPFKSPPTQRPPGLEDIQPTQNRTWQVGSSSGQPVLVSVPEQTEVVEDYEMVNADPPPSQIESQTESQTESQNEPQTVGVLPLEETSYGCQASGSWNPQGISPEMPPQPISSTERPYGTVQFREMMEMYLATWTEAQSRTETLRRLRLLCDDPIKMDIMTMFATHAVQFFDETTLPSNPHEREWMEIQLGMMQGKVTPVDLTRL